MFNMHEEVVEFNANIVPLVTIIMPFYNAGKHLRLAVKSIIKQSFTRWELILIDDGSTDNAHESISDIYDERIRFIRYYENKGLAFRLNQAIDLAYGKYCARMDSDDVSYPDRLKLQVEALECDKNLDLVAVHSVSIDDDNRFIGILHQSKSHNEISSHPWKGFRFPHPTWMGKTEWFRKYRYAYPAPYYCEDQELLLRSYKQSTFGTVPKVLFAYRKYKPKNYIKQFHIRLNMLCYRIKYFNENREFLYLVLSVVVFIALIITDLLFLINPFLYRKLKDIDMNNTGRALEWESIKNSIC